MVIHHLTGRGLKQPPVVEPIYPVEGLSLDVVNVAPRPQLVDHLCLVQANDRFRKRIVVCISNTAY